jgi:uncharacterized protein (DUF305 family)
MGAWRQYALGVLGGVLSGVVMAAGGIAVFGWPEWLPLNGAVATSLQASPVPSPSSSPSKGLRQAQGDAAARGPVDIGFAQDMTLHHEQALHMAKLALAHGTPQVHALADGILHQQLKEIGYMQGWLMLWDASATAASDDMRWMKTAYDQAQRHDPVYEQFIASCLAGQGMPGLATAGELEALSELRQAAFDSRFLALMIRHHQGAVVMARFAAEHAESEAVRGFARTIAAEQRREMAQMMVWLSAVQPQREGRR